MTPALRRLDGRRVRIAGYVVEDVSIRDAFILAPVALGESAHDEGQGDLPAAHALVEATTPHAHPLAFHGLIQVEGMLHLGRVESVSGPFWVRIELEDVRPFEFLN